MFKEYMIQQTKSSVKLIKSFSHNSSSIQKNEQISVCDKEKLIQSVTNLHKNSTISVLNYLIPSCYKMKQVWFGYKHIADQLGFCERTVQRAIHELRDLGLLQVQYRLMTSNIYKVNPQIYVHKEELKHKIPSLWGKFIVFSLALLVGNVLPSENLKNLSLYVNVTSVRGNSYLQNDHDYKLKFKKEERRRVSFDVNDLKISPILQEVTDHLKLNRHGQCILLQYPNEALDAVWFKLYETFKAKEFKHCMQTFVNSCEKYCVNKKLPVYRELYPLLLKRYDIKVGDYVIDREQKIEEPKKGCVVQVDRTEFNKRYEQRLLQKQKEAQQRIEETRKDKALPLWLEGYTQIFMENRLKEQ